jgi:hypothetical protein
MTRTNFLRCAVVLAAFTLTARAGTATPIWIQEVVYDAPGPDAAHAFTELVGPPGTSLDGFRVVGVNGSTGSSYRTIDLAGAIIPADGIFVLATEAASLALAAERDFIGPVDWQNGPDAIQLWSPLEELADALQYGDAGDGNRGEGAPAEDVAPGLSLSRDDRGTDTDDNARDFRASEPTPGKVGDGKPVPEPPAVMLLTLGTAALLRKRA